MRVVWTHQAESMLDEILDQIAAERPSAALGWFEEAMGRVRSLRRFPDVGRVVPELHRSEMRRGACVLDH